MRIPTMERRGRIAAALAMCLAGGNAHAQLHEFTHNGYRVQRLTMTGDPAPGFPAGSVFTSAGNPDTVGLGGGFAVNVGVNAPGFAGSVLYTFRDGQMVPILRKGDPAPGTNPPRTFDTYFSPIAVNAAGDVVFNDRENQSTEATWLYRSQPELLATAGMPAPGTAGFVFNYSAQNVGLSETGHVAFWNRVGPPGGGETWSGVWGDRDGPLAPLYRQGDPAPEPLSGLTMRPFPLQYTADDRLVMGADLSGPGVTVSNNHAILAERDGQLGVIAREGDPMPGVGGALLMDPFNSGSVRANEDGRVSIRGSVSGAGTTSDNNAGIWSEASGALRLVTREGDPAPGAGEGVVFDAFDPVGAYLNSAGQTLFKADLRGGQATGRGDASIWLDDNGALTMLARRGDHAPGFAPDTHFSSFMNYDLDINSFGDVAFSGEAYGSDTPSFTAAVWLVRDGRTELFARMGAEFDGMMLGTIDLMGINNLRQMMFHASYAGPDGILYTADDLTARYLVTIPEPATMGLATLSALLFVACRRRRAR